MNEYLTNRQIAFMVFGGIVGYGIIRLPKDIAEAAGTGGWIPLLITTVIVVIAGNMFTYLGYIHTEKTIYDYTILLTGKFVGKILIILYIIYFFASFTMVSRISCELINLITLIKTPVSVLNLVLLLVCFYAVTKKLKVISRIYELYGMIAIFFTLITHAFISSQGSINNLRPFIPPLGIKTYLEAIPTSIFSLMVGVETIALIPFNKNINNKKVFKYVTLMISFIGLFYIFIVESCISVLGADNIIYYNNAIFASIRRINIDFLEFLSRIDGIFLGAWIMVIFNAILIGQYATVFLLSKWFKKVSFNKLAFIVAIIGFLTTLLPKTMNDVNNILEYISYFSIFTVFVIPLILIIITKVKNYDKEVM